MSSDSKNLIALVLINNICHSKKKKKEKNQQDQNCLNETMREKQERQKCIC